MLNNNLLWYVLKNCGKRASAGPPITTTYSFGNTSFLWSFFPLLYLSEQASPVPSFLTGAPLKLPPQHAPKGVWSILVFLWLKPWGLSWESKWHGPESSQWQMCLYTFSKAQDKFLKAYMDQSIHAGRNSLMNTQWDVRNLKHSRVWNIVLLWHLPLRIL